MPKVLVLPDHIASQIAAGEVVERPASVVKELIENSIDAGATQIEISISNECRDIRVADDGCGMEADDAVLAFHRHATSKLSTADDLWSLKTMGFRGEALPSISSVAKITCLTRTKSAESGTKLEAAEGKVSSNETGCAPGTVIEVRDLFYNVPARLKFLKKASTEFSHISNIVQSLAISFPKIVFQLLNNGELVMKTSGSGKMATTMKEAGLVTGKEELIEVTYTDVKCGLAVYGYVTSPLHFKANRKGILSIVNSRPVKCPLTYKALEYAFSDLIPKGRYPIAAVTVTVDSNQVDVNVHPTKKEIKYSNSSDIYTAIQRALMNALRNRRAEFSEAADTTASSSDTFRPAETQQAQILSANESADSRTPGSYGTMTALSREDSATDQRSVAESTAEQINFQEQLDYTPPVERIKLDTTDPVVPIRPRATSNLPAGWRLIGYLHNTYFLIETPEGLEIIEQHIAHERTLYERILASQEVPGQTADHSQRLVISVPLELTADQAAAIEENLTKFQSLGFDFEKQDDSHWSCTQVPVDLAHTDYAQVVQKMIEDVCLTETAELELEATKSIACQAAIKNGMHLSVADIVQLISEWHETERNDTCPHGRPIKLKFSMEKLFSMFHPD